MKLDTYALRAQVRPGLLALFPIVLGIAVSFPEAYKIWVGMAGLIATFGVAALFAHYTRFLGRRTEVGLIESWDGMPTTRWLRHQDTTLEQATKSRYRSYLEANVPDWRSPSRQLERNRPEETDALYGSAVRWLREQTRNREMFHLIYSENISYGFRRNMLGLKPIGIIATLISISLMATLLLDFEGGVSLVKPVSSLAMTALAAQLMILVYWLIIVKSSWVKDAADAYARALLASCDALDSPKST